MIKNKGIFLILAVLLMMPSCSAVKGMFGKKKKQKVVDTRSPIEKFFKEKTDTKVGLFTIHSSKGKYYF